MIWALHYRDAWLNPSCMNRQCWAVSPASRKIQLGNKFQYFTLNFDGNRQCCRELASTAGLASPVGLCAAVELCHLKQMNLQGFLGSFTSGCSHGLGAFRYSLKYLFSTAALLTNYVPFASALLTGLIIFQGAVILLTVHRTLRLIIDLLTPERRCCFSTLPVIGTALNALSGVEPRQTALASSRSRVLLRFWSTCNLLGPQ